MTIPTVRATRSHAGVAAALLLALGSVGIAASGASANNPVTRRPASIALGPPRAPYPLPSPHVELPSDPPIEGKYTLLEWEVNTNTDCGKDHANAATYFFILTQAAQGRASGQQLSQLADNLNNDIKPDPGKPEYPDPSDPGRPVAVAAMQPIHAAITEIKHLSTNILAGETGAEGTAVQTIGANLFKSLSRLQALNCPNCA